MSDATYLIVGGGLTAGAARDIRAVDPGGSITMIGAEPDPPYKRPPLSKGLWAGKPLDRIWSKTDKLGIDLRLGRTARVLDTHTKTVVDDRGESYGFDKLLLATGSTPVASRSATTGSSISAPWAITTGCGTLPIAGTASR